MQTIEEKFQLIKEELLNWGITDSLSVAVGDEDMVLNLLRQDGIDKVYLDEEGGLVVEFPEEFEDQ